MKKFLLLALLCISCTPDNSVTQVGSMKSDGRNADVFVLRAGSFVCFVIMSEGFEQTGQDHAHKQPPQTAYLCPQK